MNELDKSDGLEYSDYEYASGDSISASSMFMSSVQEKTSGITQSKQESGIHLSKVNESYTLKRDKNESLTDSNCMLLFLTLCIALGSPK